jgi:phosphopantothenoylcysteine decarboxylase/phosphopantothenate--cysteine ligase
MAGKHIVLGVTGGIAAYKSPDIVRRLAERGAEVQVVMTSGAREFVAPLTFQAVSGREVRSDLWDESAERAMSHIELARWADLVLIAPATADFLAQLAHGMADNLLNTVCLATSAPLAVAPAMNRLMWANPATQANVAQLRARGVHVLGPDSGSQACGETGEGRMMEPVDIAAAAFALLPAEGPLKGRKVLITAGPTRERIDPVRFISNRSSGKMGYAVAQAARDRGADVVLVSGPVNLPAPPGVRRISVECAQQMHQAVMAELPGTDIFIGTAAVADYRPANPADCKIKKVSDQLDLKMERTVDILAAVAAQSHRPYTVGFAAETNDVEEHARAKLERKKLDLIAANEVGDTKVFEQDDNALTLLWPAGGRLELGAGAKTELAHKLVDVIASRYLQHIGARPAAIAR